MKKEKQTILSIKYNVYENIRYMFKNWWNFDKKSLLFCLVRIPPLVLLPIVSGLTTKFMIEAIGINMSFFNMVLIVAFMSLCIAGLNWIEPFLNSVSNAVVENVTTKYRIEAFKKMMTMNYERVEGKEGRIKFEKSRAFTASRGASNSFSNVIVYMGVSIVGLLSYIVILTVLNYLLILLLLICAVINFLAMLLWAKLMQKQDVHFANLKLKNGYLFRTLNSVSKAKDIRIYAFEKLFNNKMNENKFSLNKLECKIRLYTLCFYFVNAILILISESVDFYFLYKALQANTLSVANFIFYFGLITGFNGWVSSIGWDTYLLLRISIDCDYYRQFIDLDEKEKDTQENKNDLINNGTNIINDDTKTSKNSQNKSLNSCIDNVIANEYKNYEIVFENVSYTYEGNRDECIKNICFKIKQGENIAIVGENGAGKTTCIKLMCGFYKPTSGRILVNGIDLNSLSREECYEFFSALFQDFIILPMSIEQNISLKNENEINVERLNKVIEDSGLKDKIETLKNGVKTKMIKKIFHDAVDFSGGETQKLLLARALYKDAPILILDEPTAALDPIAENNMYLKYNEFSKNKTSIFISHRLSSTRFCDRIFYMRDGVIEEEGSHEILMENKSYYYKMYKTQGKYYSE